MFRWREHEHRTLQLLLVRRSINEWDTWSGQIAFPGGKRQKVAGTTAAADDAAEWESPRQTAQRETLEEIGLDLTTPYVCSASCCCIRVVYTTHVVVYV